MSHFQRLLKLAVVAGPMMLGACGGGTSSDVEMPASSELALSTGEDASSSGATTTTTTAGNAADAPNLFKLSHDGLSAFNGDIAAFLDRIKDAVDGAPGWSGTGKLVLVKTDSDAVFRLTFERAKLSDIQYDDTDDVPGDESVTDAQTPLATTLIAARFTIEIKKPTEDDSAYRLAARGHRLHLAGDSVGAGVLVLYRARVLDVLPSLFTGNEQIAIRFDHRFKVRREAVRYHATDANGNSVPAAWVYRRLDGANLNAGSLRFAAIADLPNLPVSGNLPEQVTLIEQWAKTDAGLVARAHAELSGGDLGSDTLDVTECMDGIDQIGYRNVKLSDGTTYSDGSHGDPSACHPFDQDITPPKANDDTMPAAATPAQS